MRYFLFGGQIGAAQGGYKGAGFTAKDNKWRFEINDKNIKLLEDPLNILSGKIKHTTLSHFISHKELFKYYPRFKSITVFFQPIEIYKKNFPEVPGSILNNQSIISSFDYKDAKDPSTYQLIFFINHETAQTLLKSRSANDSFLKWTIGELQHAIQTREGFDEDRGVAYYARGLKEEIKEARDKALKLPKNDPERLYHEKFVEFFSNENNFSNHIVDLYLNQFAEEESREAISRIKMSASERMKTPTTIRKSMKGGGILNQTFTFKELFTR